MIQKLAITSLLVSAIACKSTRSLDSRMLEAGEVVGGQSPQEVNDNEAWNSFLAASKESYEYQPACRPASFRHQGERKGMVVFFHGFTACPQQFFALGQKLSLEGWDVFLPTNPGHGMKRGPDEAKFVPQVADYEQRYSKFIKQVNSFMRNTTAPEKVVGGISLGGALATAAMIEDPELYDRALIMTPYYRLNPKIANLMGALKNVTNFARRIDPEHWGEGAQSELMRELGWGQPCEDEVARGRQGICKFTYSHLIAGQQFGYDLSQKQFVKGHIQFVGVDEDGAIDNNRVTWFVENRVRKAESKTQLCFYPKGTNHSLASIYDSPDENKFWLPRFEADTLNFVTQGRFFSTTEKKVLGYSECASGAR